MVSSMHRHRNMDKSRFFIGLFSFLSDFIGVSQVLNAEQSPPQFQKVYFFRQKIIAPFPPKILQKRKNACIILIGTFPIK